MPKKSVRLPPLDLSRYNTEEKLPGDIFLILKNALCVHNGDVQKVADLYNIKIEHVSTVLAKDYLQITQIINSSMRSKDLDKGIDDAISLLSKHVNEIKRKYKETPYDSALLKDSTITQLTRITDRFLNSKKNYNDTYSTLVNEMINQQLKDRQVNVLENGKPEDNTDYMVNQNTVIDMLNKYKSKKRIITVINLESNEVKTFEKVVDACRYMDAPQQMFYKIENQKSPYKGKFIVHAEEI